MNHTVFRWVSHSHLVDVSIPVPLHVCSNIPSLPNLRTLSVGNLADTPFPGSPLMHSVRRVCPLHSSIRAPCSPRWSARALASAATRDLSIVARYSSRDAALSQYRRLAMIARLHYLVQQEPYFVI